MPRLSSPIEKIQGYYPVVVIGSGYGGAIAASRLARAGQKVCLLERGKEFQPGEYPNTEGEALREMQASLPDGHIGSRTGLYDFFVNPDINVFTGCGLGGTSLVNANVSLEAEPRVFQDAAWPKALRDDLAGGLAEGYGRAREMLRPTPYPETLPALPKMEALGESAAYLEQRFYRTPINVTFQDGVNHVGVMQNACQLCGDCVTGCNFAAKNTTLMNYLPDARNFGAEIYTKIAVRHLERRDGRWLVHYQMLDSGQERFDAPTQFVSADVVVLAGGVLGSTEILLRSQAAGLPLSDRVGERFSGNGDVLGFSYGSAEVINGVGFGNHDPRGRAPVGPCITGVIDIREQPDLQQGMIIEEGSLPGAIAPLLPIGLAAAADALGAHTVAGLEAVGGEAEQEIVSLLGGPYEGAMHNTQTYLVMTHDQGDGRIFLKNDRLEVAWPGVGKEPIFEKVNETLERATVPLKGTYVINPTWSKLFHRDLITVHPLGGCVMAEDAAQGVVNHKGQVFSGSAGSAVHEGLYVSDGSIVPRSLGVNPLLTISALTERNCALLAQDRGWTIDYSLPSQPPPEPAEPRVPGIQFTETMRGYFSALVQDDYERGAQQGKAENSPFAFTLTIHSDNLQDMVSQPAHKARMAGTVQAPRLSPLPLTVSDGEFQLFVVNPAAVDTHNMIYRMRLTTEEGRTYFFHGFKVVADHPVLDVWHDTSTLYITIYDGPDEAHAVLGRGILHILPADFARQLTTMEVTNAASTADRLKGMATFGQFFAGVLWETYGGVFARVTEFHAEPPPRKKRLLHTGTAQVRFFATSDNLRLRLTRYRGGAKGPVILAHGIGTSSQVFAADVIDTSLVEYLYGRGYDVWLLDYRSSIVLPTAALAATGDDIAARDYPAAVAEVMAASGASSVQVVAHCWGSITFSMAMLAGLRGVRSAVCSQVATHLSVSTLTRIKTALHLPEFLSNLGVQLKERCNSPACHHISATYAPLYHHAQLNEATHDALHEFFGAASARTMEHLSLLAHKGHLVGAGGEDVYLPHLDRLAIPICFLHGTRNEWFLPESTEHTYDALCAANGNQHYRRILIPEYGHTDCIFGENAVNDVFPHIADHLEATQ